jgi:hypothetical protein
VGCRFLGSGAVLLGLLEVSDCVRVQCEFLVLRTSDLDSHPELIGGGERAVRAKKKGPIECKGVAGSGGARGEVQ